MKVSFDLTEQDYIEYNIFHNFNAKSSRRMVQILRFAFPLVFLGISVFFSKISTAPFGFWVVIFLIFSVVWIVRFPKNTKKTIAKSIRKTLREGKNVGLLGNRTIILTDDEIISESESGETKSKWNAVERLCETEQYLFVYIASVMAYIIPIRAFESMEEKNQFTLMIKKNVKNSTGRDLLEGF